MTTNMNLDEILGRAVVKGPKDDDVVVGRGGRSNHNKGNKKYIELVELYEEDYMKCARKYQKVLAVTILHYLRVKNVRFLRKDDKTEKWSSVPLRQIRLKIAQRLRERAPLKKLEKLQAEKTTAGTMATSTMVAEESIIPSQICFYNEGGACIPQPTDCHVQQQGKEVGIVTDASSDEEASSFDDLSSVSSEILQPKLKASAPSFQEVFGMPFLPIQRQDIKQKRKQVHSSDDYFVVPQKKKQRTSSQPESISNVSDDESFLTLIDGGGMEDFELEGIALDDGNTISDYEYLEYLLST